MDYVLLALVSLTVGARLGWWLHGRFSVEAESLDAPKPVAHVVAPSVPTVAPVTPSVTAPQRHLVELVDKGRVVKSLGVTRRGFRVYYPPGVAWELIGRSPSGLYQYRRVK